MNVFYVPQEQELLKINRNLTQKRNKKMKKNDFSLFFFGLFNKQKIKLKDVLKMEKL